MTADITLRHRLGDFRLDARFSVSSPGVTALFGPSGSGKSTIIQAVAGLLRAEEGLIAIDGEVLFDSTNKIDVPAQARRIGVVFQDARLFPHLSVQSNLLYGWRRAPEKLAARDIDHVVALLGLGALLGRRPRHLSGGEKQRVALGRALLMSPRALLLDEPLAALDAARKAEILPYLEKLRDEAKIPILYVSHAFEEVARLADRMIVLDRGRVTAEGSVFDISARLDLLTGTELVRGAVLQAIVEWHDDAYALTQLRIDGAALIVPRLSGAVGDTVRLRIDAQDIMLARARPEGVSANNILPVSVRGVSPTPGTHADVLLALGETQLTARITRKSAERLKLRPGDAVFAVIKTVTVGGRPHSLT